MSKVLDNFRNKALFDFFYKNPDYFFLTVGSLLSAVGVSFSAVAIYAELERIHAGPLMFTLMFVLETAPGVLGAWIANKYFCKVRLDKALFGCELIAGLLMVLPLVGIAISSISLMFVAAFIGSFTVGFMLPYHNTHVKRIVIDDDLTLVTFLSNYGFTLVFIFGCLGGSVLYSFLGSFRFVLVDMLSYFISCFFTLKAFKSRQTNFSPQLDISEKYRPFTLLKNTTIDQKKAIFLNLLLIINCSPCTALLSSLSGEYRNEWSKINFFLPLALVLISLKVLGQILGPLFVSKFRLDELLKVKLIVPSCIFLFLVFYYLIFSVPNVFVLFLLVVIAHIFSNIVFILGYYSFLRFFDDKQIGSYSVLSHQLSIFFLVISSLWSGWVAEVYGLKRVIYFCFIIASVTFYFYLKLYKTEESKNGIAYSS